MAELLLRRRLPLETAGDGTNVVLGFLIEDTTGELLAVGGRNNTLDTFHILAAVDSQGREFRTTLSPGEDWRRNVPGAPLFATFVNGRWRLPFDRRSIERVLHTPLVGSPTILSVTSTEFTASSSTRACSLPATVDVNDGLCLIFSSAANAGHTSLTHTPPSEFTEVPSDQQFDAGGGDLRQTLGIFGKLAEGDEDGTTATVTQSSASDAAGASVYRFQAGTFATDVTDWEATYAQSESTNADPPNNAPSHGSQEYAWIAIATHDNAEQTSAAPTNYTNLSVADGDGTTNDVGLASARRATTASSENPGTFTSADEKWIAATLAIPPPLGGGGGGGYLVHEEDGTSKFTLEDSSGFLILEETPNTGTVAVTLADATSTASGISRLSIVGEGRNFFRVSGAGHAIASSSTFKVTNNVLLRAHIFGVDLTPATKMTLIEIYDDGVGDDAPYIRLSLDTDSCQVVEWSEDGTTHLSVKSLPVPEGTTGFSCSFDVDIAGTGVQGFFGVSSDGSTFFTNGSPFTSAGGPAVWDWVSSTVQCRVGIDRDGNFPLTGHIRYAIVDSPDANRLGTFSSTGSVIGWDSDDSFVDGQGVTWELNGDMVVVGNLLENFTSSASGQAGVQGTVAQTLQDFTSTASGTVVHNIGTVAQTLEDFTSAASGTFIPLVTGTVAVTLEDFTSAATGDVGTGDVTGSVAVTLEDFTSTASGDVVNHFTGTADITLEDFTSTADGFNGLSGEAAVTLEDFFSTASGTVTPPPIDGTVDAFLQDVFSTASAVFYTTDVPQGGTVGGGRVPVPVLAGAPASFPATAGTSGVSSVAGTTQRTEVADE